MKYWLVVVGLIALTFSAAGSGWTMAGELGGGQVLTNADVIGMARAGMAPEVIIARIQAAPQAYDFSTRGMIAMKENGVPDAVVMAMMQEAQNPGSRSSIDPVRFDAELERYSSEDERVRSTVVAWMAGQRDDAIPLLRQRLTDPRPDHRAAATAILGHMMDMDSIPAIRTVITDSAPQVRAAAAESLVLLRDEAAIRSAEQAVARQLNPLDGYARILGHARLASSSGYLGTVIATNPDPANRIAAAWALGEIGRAGIDGRPALENALTSDADPRVRREAARAIGKIKDPQSAAVLQEACRIDPEVRKITLGAMAEYPEAVGFLVSVLSLGPDLIAADEVETARQSLVRLTGQDFGLDGSRWNDWFQVNQSRYPSTAPALATARQSSPVDSRYAAQTRREVDLEAWSIVADSTIIPMAPQVDGVAAGPGGMPASPFGPTAPPPYPGIYQPDAPSALSPTDFGETPYQAPGMAGAVDARSPAITPWSSGGEPATPPRSASSISTAAVIPTNQTDDFWDEVTMQGALEGSLDDIESVAGDFGPPAMYVSEPSPPPRAPVVTPMYESQPIAPPSGLSLPLPPMGDMASGDSPSPSFAGQYQQPVPDMYQATSVPSDDGYTTPWYPETVEASGFVPVEVEPDPTFAASAAASSPVSPAMPGEQPADGFSDLFAPVDTVADSDPIPASPFDVYGDSGDMPGMLGSTDSVPDSSFFDMPAGMATTDSQGAAGDQLLYEAASDPWTGMTNDTSAWAEAETETNGLPDALLVPGTMEAVSSDPGSMAESSDTSFFASQPVWLDTTGDPEESASAFLEGGGDETGSGLAAADTLDSYSHLIVEPEPGQVVVGDVLMDQPPFQDDPFMTAPAAVAETAPTVDSSYMTFSDESAATTPVQADAVDTAAQPAPPVAHDTYIDTRFITPPPDAEGGKKRGRRSRRGRNERQEEEVADMFRATEEAPAPVPAVAPDGTVLPKSGQDMPPMLGEGIF